MRRQQCIPGWSCVFDEAFVTVPQETGVVTLRLFVGGIEKPGAARPERTGLTAS